MIERFKVIDSSPQERLRKAGIQVDTVDDAVSWSDKTCKTCGLPFNEGSHAKIPYIGSFHYACLPPEWAVSEIIRLQQALLTESQIASAARHQIHELAKLSRDIRRSDRRGMQRLGLHLND